MSYVNYKNTNIVLISSATTLPVPTLKNGTTDAPSGTLTIAAGSTDVTGASTKFTTELVVGAWIADITHTEFRKVVAIKTDTACTLDRGFTNVFTAATPVYVQPSRIVTMNCYCAANAKIDGVTAVTGSTVIYDKSSREAQRSPIDYCDPIFVDGSSGAITAWYQT